MLKEAKAQKAGGNSTEGVASSIVAEKIEKSKESKKVSKAESAATADEIKTKEARKA